MMEGLEFVAPEGARFGSATIEIRIHVREIDDRAYAVDVDGKRIGILWEGMQRFDPDPAIALEKRMPPGTGEQPEARAAVLYAVGNYLTGRLRGDW